MFHFPGFPSCTYGFSTGSTVLHRRGCPIRRSAVELICSWPQLIAACHVLLRLLMPRHSPCALISLNFFSNSFLFSLSFSKNRLSFANNCYGCCYLLFLPQCDKIAVFYSRFGKTNVCFINLLLNYLFVCFRIRLSMNIFAILDGLVGTSGLEPPTSRLSAECSSQLSYVPILHQSWFLLLSHRLVEMRGIEPLTPCLQGRCSPS